MQRGLVCLFCVTIALAAFSTRGSSAQEITAEVGSDVAISLEAEDEVRVIIALWEPEAIVENERLTSNTTAEVSDIQTAVIEDLSPSEFSVLHQYASISALTGIINSKSTLNSLARHPYVRMIDLDTSGRGGLEIDTGGLLSTSVEIIGGSDWHELNIKGSGTTVAVIDTGVDPNHDALAGKVEHEACFFESSSQEATCPDGSDHQVGTGAAVDDHGHGTAVTGIAASSGANAPAGVAPGTGIVALKALNSQNRFWISDVLSAVDYLHSNPDIHVDVINMSFGTDRLFEEGCNSSTSWNWALHSSFSALRTRGVIAVASSMNDGSTTEMASPACLSSVVSVGATNMNDNNSLVDYTNRNDDLDVVAPGVGIETTFIGNSTGIFGGTSAAAPHVSGCALLMREVGDLTAEQLQQWLTHSDEVVEDPEVERVFPHLECFNPELLDGPLLVEEVNDFELALGDSTVEIDLKSVFLAPQDTDPVFSVESSNPLVAEGTVTNETLVIEALGLGTANFVLDASSTVGTTQTSFTVDVPKLRVDLSYNFGDASVASSYRLVGLPGQVDMDLAETLTGVPGSRWRAFRETGLEAEDGESSDAYLEEYDGSDAFRFAPGRGYWVLSRDAWKVDQNIDAVVRSEDGLSTVPLQDGWNILSNPLDASVDWVSTLNLPANDGLSEGLWEWDGAWQSADTLRSARTGKAYYLYNDGELEELTLQHPTLAGNDEQGDLVAEIQGERLELQIIAEMRGADSHQRLETARLALGFTAGDAVMQRLPPAHFAEVQLAARSSVQHAPLGRLLETVPETGEGLSFDLELTGVAAGDATYLYAEDLAVFKDQEIVLVNNSTGARHDLSAYSSEDPIRIRIKEGHLTNDNDGEDMLSMQLLIGDQDFVDTAAGRPDALAFGAVYPNPSDGEVTVEVAVPERMEIRVELFNVLGQQLGLIQSGELAPGVHEFGWDGRVTSGAEAASGVYLLLLTGPDGHQDTARLTRVR